MDLEIVMFIPISSLCVFSLLPQCLCIQSPAMSVCLLSCQVVTDSLCPIDSSPPDSSVHEYPGKIYWVGCHFLLQELFPTQDGTLISCASALAGGILCSWATWETQPSHTQLLNQFWSEQWAGLIPAYEVVGHDLILLLQTVLGMSRDLPIQWWWSFRRSVMSDTTDCSMPGFSSSFPLILSNDFHLIPILMFKFPLTFLLIDSLWESTENALTL